MDTNAAKKSKLLNVSDLATYLSVSEKTVYHWVSRNEIPYLKVGRQFRFDLGKVVDFFDAQTQASNKACQVVSDPFINKGHFSSLKSSSSRIADFVPSRKE